MKISMDGFRTNLTRDMQGLRDIIETILEGVSYYDDSDLISLTNNLICSINALNCVYSKDLDDFNDIGHLHVDLIGEKEEEDE